MEDKQVEENCVLCFENFDPYANFLPKSIVIYSKLGELFSKIEYCPISATLQNKKVKLALLASTEAVCKPCKKKFKSIEFYKKHMQKVHKKYYCKICSDDELLTKNIKFFDSFEDLQQHCIGDKGEKSPHPFCKFCGAIFKTKKEFENHTKEFHYLCEICYNKGVVGKECIFGNAVNFRNLTFYFSLFYFILYN